MTDVGIWDFAPAGYPTGSVMYTGPLLFPAGIAPGTTKVGQLVLGPGGAVANFPAVQQGLSGLPPIINFSMTQVAYGVSLPVPNPTVTLTSPGSAGVASVYSVVFTVNAGQQGPSTAFALASATDISAALTDGITLTYNGATSKFDPAKPKIGPIYSVTSIGSTALGTGAQRVLTNITIPAQPWAWWPEVSAQCVVTNAVDTRVDLIAYKNSTASDIVGRSFGAGAGAGPITQYLMPAYGSDMPGSSSYGQIAAGASATIILRAENQVSSVNQWATGSASFTVKVSPVP